MIFMPPSGPCCYRHSGVSWLGISCPAGLGSCLSLQSSFGLNGCIYPCSDTASFSAPSPQLRDWEEASVWVTVRLFDCCEEGTLSCPLLCFTPLPPKQSASFCPRLPVPSVGSAALVCATLPWMLATLTTLKRTVTWLAHLPRHLAPDASL